MPKNNEFANKVKNSNHVSTSAHDTGKESPFGGAKVTGYIPVDMEMSPKYEYFVVNAVGNCLDSDLCQTRIKDGDMLVVHQIPMEEWEIMCNVGKVVCFVQENGCCFMKQLVFWDGLSWGMRIKMFIPEEKYFFISLSKIKALFVVDMVIDKEYYNANIKPIACKCGTLSGDLVEIPIQKKTTYLTADNIEALKSIFLDETTYIEHVETLWVLRGLAEKACEIPNKKGLEYDMNSPYFRIVKLTNDLIGALLQNNIHFGFSGNEVYHWKI